MERVATEREETELVIGFELGQTNGTIGSRRAAASDGGECEERERFDERGGRILR